jgi:enterochelin esterase-like enzyme
VNLWTHPAQALDGLDVISDQFVAGLWLAMALLGVFVVRALWRRRGRPRSWLRYSLFSIAMVAALIVGAATSVNAYFAYLPTVGDVAQAATGDRQWVPADQLGRLHVSTLHRAGRDGLVLKVAIPADPGTGFGRTSSIAYLPPQYFLDSTATFPVVYLFHGSPGQASDWFHAGDAEQDGRMLAAMGRPTILVAAPMSLYWTDDPECVDGAKEKVETHLFTDVIPTIDSTFRTQKDRGGRVFAGMSAGGYCALNLGLRHTDAVATIIDLSGDTAPTHTGGAASLFGKNNPDAAADVAANSPPSYLPTATLHQPMRVWLDSGTGDTTIVHENAALSRTLAGKVSQLVWRVRPGGHTYWVWTAAMRQALPWALNTSKPVTWTGSRPGPQ